MDFNYINNFIRGNLEEDIPEIRNRSILLLENTLQNIKKVRNDERLVLLYEQELGLLRRGSVGRGLKILTPQQMLIRLPILLAQMRAGNNSKKLKNEIRQILYLLYKSDRLSKLTYNNLMKSA